MMGRGERMRVTASQVRLPAERRNLSWLADHPLTIKQARQLAAALIATAVLHPQCPYNPPLIPRL
jgi:hypothetical protein